MLQRPPRSRRRWCAHCVQSLKCPRAGVCVHVCRGMRTGCGSPLTGVAASTLTQHGKPDHPPASAFHEAHARTCSSFSNEMCHLHVISNTGTFKTKCFKPISSMHYSILSNLFILFMKFLPLYPNIWFWLCMLVLHELHLTVLMDGCDKRCVPTVIYVQWIFLRQTSSR